MANRKKRTPKAQTHKIDDAKKSAKPLSIKLAMPKKLTKFIPKPRNVIDRPVRPQDTQNLRRGNR